MASELKVCWLGNKNKKAIDWMGRLNAFLDNVSYEDRKIKARATEYKGPQENVPWVGTPFILVGTKEEVRRYRASLDQESIRVMDDCAYYWVLSNLDGYSDSGRLFIPQGTRPVVLSWNTEHYDLIADQLADLEMFPRLQGLSHGLARVRAEIKRVANQETGPWSSTLILGASGSGKEEIAHALYVASKRAGGFGAVACGSLVETLLQSELFGHEKGAFTQAYERREGLLEQLTDGAVFLDDFDAAPLSIFGALLRIMSTEVGKKAEFLRQGGKSKVKTLVWLIFSTNADIGKRIEDHTIREDFVFRFEDRVIYIPPLSERSADIPALARHIWSGLGGKSNSLQRPYSPRVINWLLGQGIEWKGNVRTLRALLSLAASMSKMPAHRQKPLQQILKEILARGPEYKHWVGIMSTPSFAGPIPEGDPYVRRIQDLDRGDDCSRKPTPDERKWPTTGSEKKAKELLKDEGLKKFNSLLSDRRIKDPRADKYVRASVRLSRAVCFVALNRQIDKNLYRELNKIGDTIAAKELGMLVESGLVIKPEKGEDDGKPVYHRAKGLIAEWSDSPVDHST